MFQVGDPKLVDKQEDFLKEYNLRYQCRRYKNDSHQVVGADFVVQTDISIRLQFQADIESKCIRLTIVNLPKLGSRRFQLRPEQLDEAFFDDLGHFILREKDDFLTLDISESEKARIREQVQKEMQERHAELKQAEADAKAEAEAEAESAKEKSAGFFKKIGFS